MIDIPRWSVHTHTERERETDWVGSEHAVRSRQENKKWLDEVLFVQQEIRAEANDR